MSPMTPEAGAALAEGERLLEAGDTDRALRAFQRVLRDAPENWRAHLGAARAYERKAGPGPAEAFWKAADREFDAAVRLAPEERDPHVARLAVAGRFGRLDALRDEYRRGARAALPFAAEVVGMIDVLLLAAEETAGARPGSGWSRLLLWALVLGGTGAVLYFGFGRLAGLGGTSGTTLEQATRLPKAVFDSAPARPAPAPFPGDGTNPRPAGELAGHSAGVKDLAFSPGGDRLVSGSLDRTVRLWSMPDGTVLWSSTEALGIVTGVGYDWRMHRISAVDAAGTIATWWVRGPQPEPAALVTGAAGKLPRIAFSPNGLLSAIASIDGTVQLGDVSSSREVARLKVNDGLRSVAFSPDGRKLALGSIRNYVIVWDLVRGGRRRVVIARAALTADVAGVAWSPSGTTLVAVCMDSSIAVFNTATWRERLSLFATGESVCSVAVAPDGKTFATGTGNGGLALWDIVSGARRVYWNVHAGPVWAVAFSPDGSILASGAEDGRILLWR